MQPQPYAFKLGSLQGAVLYDFSQPHTPGELIRDPDLGALSKIQVDYNFSLDAIPVGYNNLLLRTGEHTVLVDAGIRQPFGNLVAGLKSLGIGTDEVDTLVITHSDRDHIGGILDEEGQIVFTHAAYILLSDSWEDWSSDEGRSELTRLNNWTPDKTEYIWETFSAVQDRVRPVQPGQEFIPGFHLYPASGHRPDHSVLKVASDGQTLLHLSDTVIHPLFFSDLDLVGIYDADPAQSVETKKTLLAMCASENALVFAAHFPFPGLGKVLEVAGGWHWSG